MQLIVCFGASRDRPQDGLTQDSPSGGWIVGAEESAVEDFHGPIRVLHHAKVVSDHDPGLASALDFGRKELHHLLAEFSVQRLLRS